jgi:hypothetical protein
MADTPAEENHEEKVRHVVGDVLRARSQRKMAWVALFSMVVVTILAFFALPVHRLGPLELVIIWFYGAMSTIVCAYFGFKTWADIKNPRGG